jgi:hypothetical protein
LYDPYVVIHKVNIVVVVGVIPRAIEQVGAYKTELEGKGWEYHMEVIVSLTLSLSLSLSLSLTLCNCYNGLKINLLNLFLSIYIFISPFFRLLTLSSSFNILFQVSFIEIYNETIRDLLRVGNAEDGKHEIKKDALGTGLGLGLVY